MFYLCTKKDPFYGKSPMAIKDNILSGLIRLHEDKGLDPIFKEIVRSCMHPDPKKRLDAE